MPVNFAKLMTRVEVEQSAALSEGESRGPRSGAMESYAEDFLSRET